MSFLTEKTAESTGLAEQTEEPKPPNTSVGDGIASLNKYSEADSNRQKTKDYARADSQKASARQRQQYTAKIKQTDLILFTTQLAVMLDSGVVLSDALDAIAKQSERSVPVLSRVVMNVSETVKSGENFSKALTAWPKIFNSMFISMVKASEASGRMVEMLRVLSDYLNFEFETRKRIKAALTYPFIIALMAVAATGTLMFFVLPRFMRIYEAKGAALPKLTQMLVAFSRMLGDFQLMAVTLTTLVSVLAGLYWWFGTLTGRRTIDFIKIRTPVLGTMFIDMVVTRSMRIMSTMVNTGVNLLEALEVAQGSCENYYFQRLWAGADQKIRDGYQLSESIQISQGIGAAAFCGPGSKKRIELVAPGIIAMLQAGEKSGKLGEVCSKVSVFYEKKLEASIRSVMTFIEPLMITFLGGIIGTIAIALLLPVFRISGVIVH